MANNEYVNKVQFGDQTVMDISDTTAEAGDVIQGQTFYTRSGAPATGILGDATTSTHGLMSVEDKVKLDNINEIEIDKTIDTPAAIMSFSDGADNLPIALTVGIEPVQDLHGYDHPWPAGGGKNMLNISIPQATVANVTASEIKDNANNIVGVKISGTKSGSSAGQLYLYSGPIPANLVGQSVTVSWGAVINAFQVMTYDSSNTRTVLINDANSTSGTITIPSSAVKMDVRISLEASSYNTTIYPMIRLSSISDATFAPYSNICPISGWTGAEVVRTGKNLLPQRLTSGTIYYVTYTPQSDGTYIANGTANGGWANYIITESLVLKAGTYILSGSPSIANTYVTLVIDGNSVNSVNGSETEFTISEEKTITCRLSAKSGTAFSNTVFKPMIRRATENATFEPYSGSTYQLTFPSTVGTVYGGTLTVNQDGTGTLVVDRAIITKNTSTMNNDESYPGWTASGIKAIIGQQTTAGIITDAICNISGYIRQNTTGNNDILYFSKANNDIYLTQTQLIALAIDMQAVVTLTSPITYSLTIDQVTTLLGQNNIWSDTGNINSITYPYSTQNTITTEERYKLSTIEEGAQVNPPVIDPYETINTPAPLIHLIDAAEAPVKEIEIEINPIQNFNGYDHPWVGGTQKNLFPQARVSDTQSEQVLVNIPAGTYTFSANVTSNDTDHDQCLVLCYYGDNTYTQFKATRGGRYSTTITFSDAVVRFNFYASTSNIESEGDTFSFNHIQLEAGSTATAYEPYENVCPISGFDSVQVMSSKKNLFKTQFNTFTSAGITYTNPDGYIMLNGTKYGLANQPLKNTPIFLLAGTYNVKYRLVSGTITLSESDTQTYMSSTTGSFSYGRIYFYNQNSVKVGDRYLYYPTNNANYTLTLTQNEYITINIQMRDYTIFDNAKYLLTISKTEDIITDVGEPFQGNRYDISLPQTVYGGKLTVYGDGSGEVSINKKFYHLTADDSIGLAEQQISGFNRFTFAPSSGNVRYASTKYLACDKLPKVTSANPGIGLFGYNATNISFLSDLSTIEAFKEWLTEIGGLDIVYELATQITYQLTSPQVQTLLSENNIWANSGNINKIIYVKDDSNGLISGTDKAIIDRLISNNPQNKYWQDDGTWDSPVVMLEYGVSTWDEFIDAYNKNKDIYCKISSGDGYRIGHFDYYYYGSYDLGPYAQFNYYRSPESSSSADEVYKYRLYYNTNTWDTIVKTASAAAMVGCSANAAGTSGLVPAPAAGNQDKFLSGDGTWKSGGMPMVVLSYGNSTWDDFINAYNNNVIVYCRASSNSNPASGSQTRMAFMAYVNSSNPTNVEFQYYRSVNGHSASQMCDQVFIYKLDKTSGWSVTTREAGLKQITITSGDAASVSYNNSSNVITLKSGLPAVTSADNGKILKVVNGVWTAVTPD